MTDYLFSAPFLLFAVWTLLAVAFGVGLAQAMAHADKADDTGPPWVPQYDTERIDWNNAPKEWTA